MLLEVRDLTVAFVGDRATREVLSRVSLSVADGEVLGVVGESGSGKSILLAAILQLLQPPWRVLGGKVLLRGENLLEQDEARLAALRGKDLALALSNPRQHLNPILTIGRHLSDVIRAHRPMRHAASLAAAVELLKAVNIPDPVLRLQAYPHELSGGMCQRVILALAIANAPRLLIVDEPTSGLDVTVSVQILDLMRDAVRKLNSGLLLVSRDLGVVANYCERVVVMNAGRVVEEAEVRKFFATPQNVYSRKLLHAAAAARDADLASTGTSPVLVRTEPRPDNPLPGTSGPLLEVRNLVKRFPVRDGRVLTAVNDVSFAIERGEAVGLVGESGSGKTTVGRCVLRLIEPTSGSLRFNEQEIRKSTGTGLRKLRAKLQMVFQDPFDSLDPRQSLSAAIEEPLSLTTDMTRGERKARVADLLGLVGLDQDATNLYPHQVSAGELQRVGIARAIATQPDLVVFDEPTSALDVSVRADISESAQGPAAATWHVLPLHLARFDRGAPAVSSHRDHVSRQACRGRRDRRTVPCADPPLFPGAALIGPLSGSRAAALALLAEWRDPKPDRPALGLRAAHALPDGDRRLHSHRARARGESSRPPAFMHQRGPHGHSRTDIGTPGRELNSNRSAK